MTSPGQVAILSGTKPGGLRSLMQRCTQEKKWEKDSPLNEGLFLSKKAKSLVFFYYSAVFAFLRDNCRQQTWQIF